MDETNTNAVVKIADNLTAQLQTDNATVVLTTVLPAPAPVQESLTADQITAKLAELDQCDADALATYNAVLAKDATDRATLQALQALIPVAPAQTNTVDPAPADNQVSAS